MTERTLKSRAQISAVGGLLFLTCELAVPAIAAVGDDVKICADVTATPDAQVASCTRVIDSGQWSGTELAWAYSNRGNVYLGKGDLARAIKDFDEAIKLDPTYADAFYNRGVAFSDRNELDRAIKDFDQAIQLKPEDAGALSGRCYARAIVGKDLEGALADCDKSLKLEVNGYTYDSRGLVHLRLDKNEEALADFDAALKEDAGAASSLFGRGVAKRRLGDKPGGDKDIAAAKKIDRSIAKTFAQRGVTS